MLPKAANEEDHCCCGGSCHPSPPPSSNHLLLPLAGQGGGGSAYIALLPPSASSAGALILPLARRQRLPPPPERCGGVDAAETSREEDEEEEEEEEEESVPSTPLTVSAPPPPPVKPEPNVAPAAPASVKTGELITSAVSGRSYAVLRTIAGDAVGHEKKHTSILLAAPLPLRLKEGEGVGGGLLPSKQTTTTARVVIKVIQQASYMQRYADAPPANGRAIGELAAHQRLLLPTTTAVATSTSLAPDTHVLPLLDVLADPTHIYMVFPYADGPDLFDAVAATRRGLPEQEARRYFVDMAMGVLFLKRHGVSHGDISLENACLHCQPDGAFSCHLIDLEMARLVSVDGAISPTTLLGARLGLSYAGGKPGYVSPEGAYGTILDFHATDMWSLGVCLYVMLTARPLYTHAEDRAFEIIACGGAPFLIDHYAVTYGLTLPPGAAELVMFLLQPDPRDRPTVEDVLLHPWVNDGVEGQQQRQWRPPAVISETRDVQKQ